MMISQDFHCRYGFSSLVSHYSGFGFHCLGSEANINHCHISGTNCVSNSTPYAVAVRCGEGASSSASMDMVSHT